MNRIAEVKQILFENGVSNRGHIARQIDQFYKPQPDHTPECIKHKATFGSVGCTCKPDQMEIVSMPKGYGKIRDGRILGASTPDHPGFEERWLEDEANKTRLLTVTELAYIKMEHVKETGIGRKDIKDYVDAVRDAQDAKTASIKDAEYQKLGTMWADAVCAQNECQAKIEALMKELDTFCVNYDHYGTDKAANTRRRCCNKCWQELKVTSNKEEHNEHR